MSGWKQRWFLNNIGSWDLNVIVVIETRRPAPTLERLWFIFPGCPSSGSAVLVLIKRNWVSKKKLIFLIQNIGFYAPNMIRQREYFCDLEKFLGTSHSLVLMDNCNTICNELIDYVCIIYIDRKGNPFFLDCIQLADPYGQEFPNAPLWTWSKSDRSSDSEK